MSTYLNLYSQIKSLEPVFQVPANYETRDVGTFDAASGAFSGLKTSVRTEREPIQHDSGQQPRNPAPHYQGDQWVSVTIGRDWRMTETRTPAPKVGLAPVLLEFGVKNQQNSAWTVTVQAQTVKAPASQVSLLINIWDLPMVVWKISCGGKSYSDTIMIQRPANAIVGAGAFTVPALPLSIVYAPPADDAKASRTSYSVSEIVGTTSSFQITSDTSSSHPWLPQNLADLNTLQTGLNGISAGLSNFKDPYSKAIGVACGAIASGIGKMSGTTTSGTVSDDSSTMTVTESRNEDIYAETKNGGPGEGDSIHYLRDAKFAWLMSGGQLQICLLGGVYASYPAKYLKQHSAETQTTGIPPDVTNMLLGLDPFVAGGPATALPSPRYKDISAELNGPIEYGGGQPMIGSYAQTYSVTDTRTSTSYNSQVQDFNPGWLATIFGAHAQTLKTSVSVTHAAGTTQTDTQTYSWELHSGPNEHFIVEFWLDQVFGTLALRQQQRADNPRVRGVAKGPMGQPLIGQPVTLTLAAKIYHTVTDSHGQYTFFSTAIPEGSGTVQIGNEPPHAVMIDRNVAPPARPR